MSHPLYVSYLTDSKSIVSCRKEDCSFLQRPATCCNLRYYLKACLYRARPRGRTQPLRLSARLSARKFAQTTAPTERGYSGCDSCIVCSHAPSLENGSKRLTHRFLWYFTSSHGGGEGRGDTGVYLYNRCATDSNSLRVTRVTWAELHENKRTDWLI